MLKPALVEAAQELTQEVEEIGREVVRGVKKTAKKDAVIHSATSIVVIGTVLMMIWLVFRLMSPNFERSGSQYSEQFKRFAPHLNRPAGNGPSN
ncbi:hypothetical protein E3A20_30440 [Planctomyces bekefii]|uniref:Uncharacterized protein n=1 Tax=Planctomyces bekefii TaxID=1653850 RepID=A0A5C6M0H7_9PLAN|nr:hypothetical protein E3A20_30440 [Planctomyces bekefii]